MKTGLLVEGGGMKCAFSAGILDKFLDDGISFDYTIGVSAGSGNLLSYLAKQRGRNRRFYTDYIDDPRYLSLSSYIKTGNLFGMDFIYGELSNEGGLDPLDYDALMDNPAEFCCVATDARRGKPAYFYKKDLIRNDYRHIKAGASLPGYCKPIEIDGEFYYDGGISDNIPLRHAFEDGCDRVVVLLSKPRSFRPKPEKYKLLYRMSCKKYPHVVGLLDERHIMVSERLRFVRRMEKEGRVFVIAPVNPPHMSTYAKDKMLEWELYGMGIRQYLEVREGLKEFMR